MRCRLDGIEKFPRTLFENLIFWEFMKMLKDFKSNSKTYSDVHNSFQSISEFLQKPWSFISKMCFSLNLFDFLNFEILLFWYFFLNSLHELLYKPPCQWLGRQRTGGPKLIFSSPGIKRIEEKFSEIVFTVPRQSILPHPSSSENTTAPD